MAAIAPVVGRRRIAALGTHPGDMANHAENNVHAQPAMRTTWRYRLPARTLPPSSPTRAWSNSPDTCLL